MRTKKRTKFQNNHNKNKQTKKTTQRNVSPQIQTDEVKL